MKSPIAGSRSSQPVVAVPVDAMEAVVPQTEADIWKAVFRHITPAQPPVARAEPAPSLPIAAAAPPDRDWRACIATKTNSKLSYALRYTFSGVKKELVGYLGQRYESTLAAMGFRNRCGLHRLWTLAMSQNPEERERGFAGLAALAQDPETPPRVQEVATELARKATSYVYERAVADRTTWQGVPADTEAKIRSIFWDRAEIFRSVFPRNAADLAALAEKVSQYFRMDGYRSDITACDLLLAERPDLPNYDSYVLANLSRILAVSDLRPEVRDRIVGWIRGHGPNLPGQEGDPLMRFFDWALSGSFSNTLVLDGLCVRAFELLGFEQASQLFAAVMIRGQAETNSLLRAAGRLDRLTGDIWDQSRKTLILQTIDSLRSVAAGHSVERQ